MTWATLATWATWVLVAVAGGLGAVCRYLVDRQVGSWTTRLAGRGGLRGRLGLGGHPDQPGSHDRLGLRNRPDHLGARNHPDHSDHPERPRIPWGTMVVNVSACLLMGLVAALAGGTAYKVLATGFLGGYSTFSTACVEGARLLLAGRYTAGAIHTLLMVGLAWVAVVVGLALGGLPG